MKRPVTWIVAALMVLPAAIPAYAIPSAPPTEATQEITKPKSASAKEVPAAAKRESPAAASRYTLTVLSPQGPVKKVRDLAPRLGTLEGKKVALWLSATPDQVYAGKGAELYDVLAKMLKEKFSNIDIVPYSSLPMKFAPENEVVSAIMAVKPDAAVAALGG